MRHGRKYKASLLTVRCRLGFFEVDGYMYHELERKVDTARCFSRLAAV